MIIDNDNKAFTTDDDMFKDRHTAADLEFLAIREDKGIIVIRIK